MKNLTKKQTREVCSLIRKEIRKCVCDNEEHWDYVMRAIVNIPRLLDLIEEGYDDTYPFETYISNMKK